MSNEVVYKLRVENLGSATLLKMSKDVDRLNLSAGKFSGKFDSSTRSLNQLNAVLNRTQSLYKNTTDPERMSKYADMISRVRSRMDELDKSTKLASEKTGGFFEKLQSGLGIGKGFIGIAAGVAAVKKIFDVGADASKAAAQVEKYNVTLKTMLGSSSAARDRMAEYISIAKKTPFELNQVVEGGNQLQAIGRYSKQNLLMLGDLAAASGKPIEQVMGAFAKLATGQKGIAVDMFRDLLISADDWTKATGKGVTKTGELKATTEELIKALPKIMAAKGFFGMMQNQADTTDGRISNLKDGIFQMETALGERLNPTVNSFTELSTAAVDKLTDWIAIPIEQKIAAEKTEVNYLMDKLIEIYPHQDERKKLIDEINQKYPELLKNLDLETGAQDKLRQRLADVNAEYDKKMRKATLDRMLSDTDEKAQKEMEAATKYEMSINARKNRPALLNKVKDKFGANAFVANGKLYDMKSPGNSVAYDLNNADPKFAAEAYQMIAEVTANDEMTSYWVNDVEGRKKAMNSYTRLKARRSAIESAIGVEETNTTTGGTGTGGTGTGTGGTNLSNSLNSTASAISSGGSKPTNITINLNKEMIGAITINPQTMTQGTGQIKDMLMEMLSQVLNSGNKLTVE